jgi:HEAT repeat protein
MSLFGPPNVEKLKAKGDVKGLIKALGYKKDAEVRKEAAQALGEIGDTQAVEPLIATLKDENRDVRRAAAEMLGKIGDVRAVEPLITAIKDSARGVCQAAIEALDKLGWQPDRSEAGAVYWIEKRQWDKCVEVGAPAVEPLIATLKDVDAGVRKAAAEVLGKIGDVRAVEPLITAIKDSARSVRQADIGTLIKDSARGMCQAAIEALDKLGWQPDKSEVGAAYWIEKRQWDKCVEVGAPAVEPLVATLITDKDADVREAAAEALDQLGWQPDTRMAQAAYLAVQARARSKAMDEQLGDPRVVERLIAALQDEDKYVRYIAIEKLGKTGNPQVVEPLIAALQDEDGTNRITAANALDELGWQPDSSEFEAAYLAAKGKWDECVKIGALAVKPLIVALDKAFYATRLKAAEALGQIGDTQAVEPLIATLKDEEEGIRKAAAEALTTITGRNFGEDAARWQEWWEEHK